MNRFPLRHHASPGGGTSATPFAEASRWLRWSRRTLIIVVSVLVLLIILRALAPIVVLRYVNQLLNQKSDYRGHAEQVDLNLWRGAYKIYGLKLEKRTARKTYAPFIELPLIDFSVEWKALLHGAFVGEVELYRPKLNLIDSKTESERQLTIEQSWGDQFKKLFPLKLNRFVIHDGTLLFHNPHSNPPVHLKMEPLNVIGTNLTNQVAKPGDLSGHIDITSGVLKTGRLVSHIAINPTAKQTDLKADLELKQVSFPELNDFLRAYVNVDAEKGNFQLYGEVRVQNGQIDGYVKPIIDDLSLIKIEDLVDNPLRFFWEAIVSVFTFFFTNHLNDTVATRIPFHGTVDSPNPDWLALLGGLFQNAYIEHIKPRLDSKEVSVNPHGEKKVDDDKQKKK